MTLTEDDYYYKIECCNIVMAFWKKDYGLDILNELYPCPKCHSHFVEVPIEVMNEKKKNSV